MPPSRRSSTTSTGEVEAIDKDLVRLRQVEKAKAFAAKPVIKADTAHDGAAARGGSSIIVKAQPKLPPGIALCADGADA